MNENLDYDYVDSVDDEEHNTQLLEAEDQVALPNVREKQFYKFKTDKDYASEQVVFQPQILIVFQSSVYSLVQFEFAV